MRRPSCARPTTNSSAKALARTRPPPCDGHRTAPMTQRQVDARNPLQGVAVIGVCSALASRASAACMGAFVVASLAPAMAEPLELGFPVACEIGKTCFVQNYVDHDAGPGVRDYMCGTLTYDGHTGTDIRVPTTAAQQRGVDVLAAADGEVLRRRDGMPDVSMRAAPPGFIEGRDCGNGVVLRHADGWETQYCHMAQGSIRVTPGEQVKAGQPIGRVGISGKAEFPHLHLTVRRHGTVVDPFALAPRAGACGSGTSLWAPDLRAALAYRERTLLNAGFAAGPVTMEAIESGEAGRAPLATDAPALVAFVRAIGLRGGDVQRLVVTAPDGQKLVDRTAAPLDRSKAQFMLFTGVKRPAAGFSGGTYAATYTVLQGGTTVLEESFAVNMTAAAR